MYFFIFVIIWACLIVTNLMKVKQNVMFVGTELHDPERLKRHMKKAHGNVPAKKLDPNAGDGGTW